MRLVLKFGLLSRTKVVADKVFILRFFTYLSHSSFLSIIRVYHFASKAGMEKNLRRNPATKTPAKHEIQLKTIAKWIEANLRRSYFPVPLSKLADSYSSMRKAIFLFYSHLSKSLQTFKRLKDRVETETRLQISTTFLQGHFSD